MATKGNSQTVLVDEFIFGGNTSSIELSVSTAELDITDLHSTAMEYIAGLPDARITQNGYFDGAEADGFEYEMEARLGTNGVQVTYLPIRGTTNTPAYTIPDVFGASMNISSEAAGLITLNGDWVASESIHRGALVCYNTEITGTGGGTSIDLGSAGSAGGYAYLHVHTIDDDDSGTSTNTDIDIESSANDSSFDSEGTFTFSATGAATAVTMSGTVNRYIRYNCTDLGGATSLEVSLIVVVDGVTENIA